MQCGMQSGKQPLRCRFFIARSAVDLATKKQAVNLPGFKAALEATRIEIVVFNAIARPHDVGVFQARNGMHQFHLGIERQAGSDAIHIKLRRG